MVPEVRYARPGDVSIDRVGALATFGSPIGARVAAQAGPGEVLASHAVRDLVAGSGIEFEDRGGAELEGITGEWRLYMVAWAT